MVRVYVITSHILEQRIRFEQQIPVKTALIEYQCVNKLVFKAQYALALVNFIVRKVSFIHQGRVSLVTNDVRFYTQIVKVDLVHLS